MTRSGWPGAGLDDVDARTVNRDGGQDWSAKPDPDEPWRFACPDCGSTDVSHRVTPTLDRRRFECGRCHWYGWESELVDRRRE
jgi:predicted RNA-binding Zn-ribbon protein involved in translation (DUF1610 family)